MSSNLSSWSRRRAAVAEEAAQEEAAALEAAQALEQEAIGEQTDEEILEELGLPDPETLVHGDDFKAFMAKAVPQHLRKRALRKLWRSNPVLACVDGLNDYDDDYLTQGLGQGKIKTSYQVGKGMLAHILDVKRLKDEALEAASTVPALVVQEEEEPEPEEVAIAEPIAEQEVEEAPASFAPRRMQFQFEDDAT